MRLWRQAHPKSAGLAGSLKPRELWMLQPESEGSLQAEFPLPLRTSVFLCKPFN